MAIVKITNNRYTVDGVYQWDTNQVLEIHGLSLVSAPEIHFTNAALADRAVVRRATMDNAGIIRVDIPNSFLQKPYNITAYICAYSGSVVKTLHTVTIPLTPRSKPNDYELADTDGEVYSFLELERQITTIQESLDETQVGVDQAMAKADEVLAEVNNALTEAEEILDKASDTLGDAEEIKTSQTELSGKVDTNTADIATLETNLNELKTNVGTLANLTTDDKTDIVVAINEMVTRLNELINSLHTVATSGSYNDLGDKPTIPSMTWDSSTSTLTINAG